MFAQKLLDEERLNYERFVASDGAYPPIFMSTPRLGFGRKTDDPVPNGVAETINKLIDLVVGSKNRGVTKEVSKMLA